MTMTRSSSCIAKVDNLLAMPSIESYFHYFTMYVLCLRIMSHIIVMLMIPILNSIKKCQKSISLSSFELRVMSFLYAIIINIMPIFTV